MTQPKPMTHEERVADLVQKFVLDPLAAGRKLRPHDAWIEWSFNDGDVATVKINIHFEPAPRLRVEASE